MSCRAEAAVRSMASQHPPGLVQRYREDLQTRREVGGTVETDEPWLRWILQCHRPQSSCGMGSAEVNALRR